MNLDGQLSVLGHAMLTAVGSDGPSTCAAMKAGASGAREANLWDFTVGEYLQAARTRMHQWWEGPTMVPELATPVIRQCWQQALQLGLAQGTDDAPAVPVLIVLPPADRPHRSPELDRLVLDGLAQRFGRPLPQGSCTVANGRTGILPALRIAHGLLSHHGAAACIIVGVESFLRQVLIEHYIEQRRLLCGSNRNGFVPGEAACAVLVARPGAIAADELVIAGMGLGLEPDGDGRDADNSVSGEGLIQAIRHALGVAGIACQDLDFSLSDLNGESSKLKEAAMVVDHLDRLPADGGPRHPHDSMKAWHPAECIGEVGAAIFPCLLGWAFEAGLKGYAPGRHALLHAGEDNGERVALVTRWQPHREDR